MEPKLPLLPGVAVSSMALLQVVMQQGISMQLLVLSRLRALPSQVPSHAVAVPPLPSTPHEMALMAAMGGVAGEWIPPHASPSALRSPSPKSPTTHASER